MADKELENTPNSVEIAEMGRTPDGKFLPGHSVHKPKGTKHFASLFAEILKEEVVLKDGSKITVGKAMAHAMARKAMKGDVHAFDSVADRMDGKPAQSIDVEVTTPPTPIYGGKSTKKV